MITITWRRKRKRLPQERLSMTRIAAVTTIMQDWRKETKSKRYTKTSFDGIIRPLTVLTCYISHISPNSTGIARNMQRGRKLTTKMNVRICLLSSPAPFSVLEPLLLDSADSAAGVFFGFRQIAVEEHQDHLPPPTPRLQIFTFSAWVRKYPCQGIWFSFKS